jgi:Ca2+-binding EF-hand superfamily protein
VTVANGSQEEYKLRQIFNEFDANKSGTLTVDEIAAVMAKL